MAIDSNHTTTTTAPSTAPTTTATATTTTRPIRPISSSPVPPNLYPSQALPIRTQSPSTSPVAVAAHHKQGVLYPVASSGRGFIPRPIWPATSATAGGEQTVTVANAGAGAGAAYASRPLLKFPPQQPLSLHLMRPTYNVSSSPHPPPIKGLPPSSTPEVAPSSVADSNGLKNIGDKSRDDNLAVIKGRKVRITDGASLYVQCRSWLRNGFPEECQPQYGDTVRTVPKPSPIPMVSATLPKKEEGEQEKDRKKDHNEEEDEEYVQRSSPHDLLKGHVKRARKVRARLREERLQRIARYKSRLGLLLPPLVEQFRNDLAAGN